MWINGYHQKCRDLVGPELEKLKELGAYEWLMKETEKL
jgi:hypothetical protein